jgi:hypothetical protein
VSEQRDVFLDADRAYAFGVTGTDDEVTFSFHDDNAQGGDVVPSWTLDRDKTGALFNALGAWLADGSLAIEIEPRERMAIFGDIHLERRAQDEEWGGPAHDDEHTVAQWLTYIDYQMQRARKAYISSQPSYIRERFVKIAALAVAAIESYDRVIGGRT